MSIIRKIKRFFRIAVACFAVNAACFLFMPAFVRQSHAANKAGLIVLGIVFYVSLLAGIAATVCANAARREFARTRLNGDYRMDARIGAFSFFGNIPATVFDVTLIVSAAAFAAVLIIGRAQSELTFAFLSLLVLSLYMHCLFNGRIYKSTKYKRVRR